MSPLSPSFAEVEDPVSSSFQLLFHQEAENKPYQKGQETNCDRNSSNKRSLHPGYRTPWYDYSLSPFRSLRGS
jgi:hypothetical protein